MNSFRVGFNKGFGVMMLVLAGLQFVIFTLTQKGMYIGLAALWVVIGIMYMSGTCFIVDLTVDGSGEVQIKNPIGMTLKRHAFSKLADLSFEGTKLVIRTTKGETKKVGGFGADGGDMKKLSAWLDERRKVA